jgi:hypothetical protein
MSIVATVGVSQVLDQPDAGMSDTAVALQEMLVTGEGLDSSNSWLEANEHLIQFLRRQYRFESERVSRFLRRNSDVAWLLLSARQWLENSFAAPINVQLNVTIDPDDEELREQLFGYIETALDIEDAAAALTRFDREWFLASVDKVAGRLNFDLHF